MRLHEQNRPETDSGLRAYMRISCVQGFPFPFPGLAPLPFPPQFQGRCPSSALHFRRLLALGEVEVGR